MAGPSVGRSTAEPSTHRAPESARPRLRPRRPQRNSTPGATPGARGFSSRTTPRDDAPSVFQVRVGCCASPAATRARGLSTEPGPAPSNLTPCRTDSIGSRQGNPFPPGAARSVPDNNRTSATFARCLFSATRRSETAPRFQQRLTDECTPRRIPSAASLFLMMPCVRRRTPTTRTCGSATRSTLRHLTSRHSE